MNNVPPAAAAARGHVSTPARLGFAVMLEQDGVISEESLIGLKAAGYAGIEPNCFEVRHLGPIAEMCQNVGMRIHAIPTGRWLNTAAASADYGRYTKRAFEVLSEGADMAASVDAPLIFGLIRGARGVTDAEAQEFLSSVIGRILQRTPQVRMLVEPIAPGEAAWPHTIPQGAQLIRMLNHPHVQLLADSYHIARSGENVQIEHYRDSIGHLHIRDHHKQIPTTTAPEYASILRLWHEGDRILSFEPNIELSHAVAQAVAGVQWLNHEQRRF